MHEKHPNPSSISRTFYAVAERAKTELNAIDANAIINQAILEKEKRNIEEAKKQPSYVPHRYVAVSDDDDSGSNEDESSSFSW